jgi:3-hydroxyisobutyrate dehydrogenase-like beta-hydroxyacid dehydrogenase
MRMGFIGLGVQGKPIALNLIEAGHAVSVFDIDPAALGDLASAGATACRSARAVAQASEIVGVCVQTDAQLRDVLLGADGLLAGAARNTVIVVHSTVPPRTIMELAEVCAGGGVDLIDAPVSGGPAGAKAKTLSFMVGGDDAVAERCQPLFLASGGVVTRTGAVGSGAQAKLIHQLVLLVNMMAASEGYRLAAACGLSREVIEAVIANGSAQSRVAARYNTIQLKAHALPLFQKDMTLAVQLAQEMDVDAPAAALAKLRLEEFVP